MPNLWIKNNGNIIKNPMSFTNEDLNKLPLPDKKLYHDTNYRFNLNYSIITGRGCVFKCSYCSNNFLHKIYKGKLLRKRSIENIIAELEWAKREFNPERIDFVDDFFGFGEKLLVKKFLDEYLRKINLPYSIATHCFFINEDVCKLLKNTNCFLVLLGLQTADENYRKKVLYRPEINNDYIEAARFLKKYRIPFSIDHIFNMPMEDEESYRKSTLFYNELRPTFIITYLLQYFPNTDIIKFALDKGVIDEADVENIYEGVLADRINIGFGRKGFIDRQKKYSNFLFWMNIMPLIPKGAFRNLFSKFNSWPKDCPNVIIVSFKLINRLKSRFGFKIILEEFKFHLSWACKYFYKLFQTRKDEMLSK